MNIKNALKKSKALVGLIHDIRDAKEILKSRLSKYSIDDYIKSASVPRLHLGASNNVINEWLNSDKSPTSVKGTIYLDVTRKFPINDNCFCYVFSEHLIEHLTYKQGLFMLQEGRRVLKPGGKIRIATPSLKVLLSLQNGDLTSDGENYIRWITDKFLPEIKVYKACFVINNAFRNWGHQFLYDEDTLCNLMRQAGFVNIKQFSPGISDDIYLQNIETHGINIGNTDVNNFETMVFEATCAK